MDPRVMSRHVAQSSAQSVGNLLEKNEDVRGSDNRILPDGIRKPEFEWHVETYGLTYPGKVVN